MRGLVRRGDLRLRPCPGARSGGRGRGRGRGEDEDGASDAEGVETGDFYALLDNEDAAVVAGL